MKLWRVLTHVQAENEYERVELQLLQLEGSLTYPRSRLNCRRCRVDSLRNERRVSGGRTSR